MSKTTSVNAADALSQTMAYYGRSMTMLEGDGWGRIIRDFGSDAVIAFLQSHMESSSFAPKLDEALKAFAPGRKNSVAAYEALCREVRFCGPYRAPTFDDPALPRTVHLMGGWLAVNEQMPEAGGSFETSAFIKRFDAMYAQACSDVLLMRDVDSKLRGLHDLTRAAGLLENKPSPARSSSLRVPCDVRNPIDGGEVIDVAARRVPTDRPRT